MKKTLCSFLAIALLSAYSFAQQATPKKESAKTMECCAMKNGKMVCMKNGKATPMDHEMTMNGMTVMPDGTCKMKNGKTMKLKNGQCCDKDGKIHSDCGE